MRVDKWARALQLLLWSLALGSLQIVSAANFNVTVDDADNGITYSVGWNIRNANTPCEGYAFSLSMYN